MRQKSLVMLRVLLDRYYADQSTQMIELLPPPLCQEVKELSTEIQDPLSLLQQPSQRIAKIHFSWLALGIKGLAKALQLPAISSLKPLQSNALCHLLGLPSPSFSPISPLKEYLLEMLYREVCPETITPLFCLPHSPLTPLAFYSKIELQRLIDLLGLRDLAQQIRLIVDKKYQKRIVLCLTEEEQQFLDFYIYKEQEKFAPQLLDLKSWDGTKRALRQQIHKRGLIRLGKALSEQDANLLWHIFHTLDTGRAHVLKINGTLSFEEGIAYELRRQVVGIINHFSKDM